jgi:hypothetical protein
MDVFELRRRLIDDYRAYVTGFISIRDERVRRRSGHVWNRSVYFSCTYSVDFVRIWSIWRFAIIGSSCTTGWRDGSSPPFRTKTNQGSVFRAFFIAGSRTANAFARRPASSPGPTFPIVRTCVS